MYMYVATGEYRDVYIKVGKCTYMCTLANMTVSVCVHWHICVHWHTCM